MEDIIIDISGIEVSRHPMIDARLTDQEVILTRERFLLLKDALDP